MVLLYLRAQSWHGSMQYGADSPILHHMHAVVRMVSISLCCTYIHAFTRSWPPQACCIVQCVFLIGYSIVINISCIRGRYPQNV